MLSLTPFASASQGKYWCFDRVEDATGYRIRWSAVPYEWRDSDHEDLIASCANDRCCTEIGVEQQPRHNLTFFLITATKQSGDKILESKANTCLGYPICGDKLTEWREECDDGNPIDDDACDNFCRINFCGDGRVNNGEECDDGNVRDGDACTSECKRVPNYNILTGSWAFFSNGIGSAQKTDEGWLIKLLESGSNVQFSQSNIALHAGRSYILTVTLRANAATDVDVAMIQNTAPYSNLGLSFKIGAGMETSTQSLEFLCTKESPDSRLMFWFVPYQQPGLTYLFESISLVEK